MPLHVNGPEQGKLSDAIKSACGRQTLDQLLKVKLDIDLSDHASIYDDYQQARYLLIQYLNGQWRLDRLVQAMLEYAPDNGLIVDFARRHGVIAAPPGDGGLERMINQGLGFSDPVVFWSRLGKILTWVCKVSVQTEQGLAMGTGFLIGPDLVMTNFHVVESAIRGAPGASSTGISCLFDYRTTNEGDTVSPGVKVKLVNDDKAWLVDSKPYDSSDTQPVGRDTTLAGTRPVAHLDYAILRLERKLGSEPLGEKPAPGSPERHWLSLPRADRDFEKDFAKDTAVFIFQHPSGDPLRFDWRENGMLGRNANGSRVLYTANTVGGSSGSPVFNRKLELIALHHAGGPDWPKDVQREFNQGVPIGMIRAALDEKGIACQ